MEVISSLNPQQQEAVTHAEGPLLILAGAGSGKTRVITYRIAHLIGERGIAPYNILAVTFTNKAAQEMRNRVGQLLAEHRLQSAPLISTFHSLCVRILRQDIAALGENYTREFTIYDQDDSIRLIKNCIRDLAFDEKSLGPRSVQSAISSAKNRGEDPKIFSALVEFGDQRRAEIARVFSLYNSRLAANNALDFDDLLIKAVQLLRKSEDVRRRYNDRYRYILVDEYQDTNSLQFALIHLLTEKQKNICVVGDEDQSIYKWRGADISNILNFEQHFRDAKIIRLEQNYRSTQNILDLAGAIVKNNTERKGKTLWTANPGGERIRYFQAVDGDAEARFVAAMIEEHRRQDQNLRAAVLYRTNSQSRSFEEALRRRCIRYNIVGGFSFYDRAEVKDIISYLKLAMNPNDSIALMRVVNSPARGIGKQTLDELERRAREFVLSHWQTLELVLDRPEGFSPRAIAVLKNFHSIIVRLGRTMAESSGSAVSDVVKAAIRDTGYENSLKVEGTDEAEARIENLQELVNAAVEYDRMEEGLRDFIDHAALVADADQYDGAAPVTLMTVHSAKGLEFPLVFVVGLEDRLFPHARSIGAQAELEEERRLCYVAITRAERYLYVTHAMRRRVYGEELLSEPSQFLNEMPHELLEDMSGRNSWLSFARRPSTVENREAIRSLRGERSDRPRVATKTYDSVESIAEFFSQREKKIANSSSAATPESSAPVSRPSIKRSAPAEAKGFVPGSHVYHAKYGRGLVLRREDDGDSAKLTVSFPGFGQKKLVEKFAGLEKA